MLTIVSDYAKLLALVSPYITYKDIRWRKTLSPDEQLAVTIFGNWYLERRKPLTGISLPTRDCCTNPSINNIRIFVVFDCREKLDVTACRLLVERAKFAPHVMPWYRSLIPVKWTAAAGRGKGQHKSELL